MGKIEAKRFLVAFGAERLQHASPKVATSLSRPISQPGAHVELVPFWIHPGHAAQPWQALVRRFLHSNPPPPKFLEPCVDVSHVQVDQAACRAIARVLSQTERHAVARHLRKDRKSWFESMFRINLKPRPST